MSRHPDLRPLIEGGELASQQRFVVLRHVEQCASCRAALAEENPSRLFALLALEPVPTEALEQVSRRVARAVETAARRAPRRRLAIGSLAASLLLAGLLSAYVWTRRVPGPMPPTEPARVERVDRPMAGAEVVPAGMTVQQIETDSKERIFASEAAVEERMAARGATGGSGGFLSAGGGG